MGGSVSVAGNPPISVEKQIELLHEMDRERIGRLDVTEDEIRRLVRELCEKVDGGCSDCSHQAVRCIGSVWPQWAAVAEAEWDSYWSR